jgi:hypothetical protein
MQVVPIFPLAFKELVNLHGSSIICPYNLAACESLRRDKYDPRSGKPENRHLTDRQ